LYKWKALWPIVVHKHNKPTEPTPRGKNHINPYKSKFFVLFVTVLFTIYEEEKIVRVYTE
jgi:hypothetical protein